MSLIVIIIGDFIQLIIITVTLKIHFNLWLIEHNSIYLFYRPTESTEID